MGSTCFELPVSMLLFRLFCVYSFCKYSFFVIDIKCMQAMVISIDYVMCHDINDHPAQRSYSYIYPYVVFDLSIICEHHYVALCAVPTKMPKKIVYNFFSHLEIQ